MSKISGYDVIRRLSEGAFGFTYEARHTILQELACIKHRKASAKPDLDALYLELFRQEARILAKLHHPSLPALREYLEIPGQGEFIIMSHIEGTSLLKFIESNRAITDEHVMWIMQRQLEALSYLHHLGIIHSDVKPENILLQLDIHNAVLLDFGLAARDPHAKSRANGGTPGYMPPEFQHGLPPVPASDFYSLAKVALFLAGGDPASGKMPADMCDPLKSLLGDMLIFDARERRARLGDDGRAIANRITDIRQQVYKRTDSAEVIAFR